jgi:ribonucleoside-diphosphate reductase alpha chain
MIMRVAVGIHGPNVKLGTPGDLDRVLETYTYMSEKWFTHATPTLFNAATTQPQLSSCFLLTMTDDSIDGIYEYARHTATLIVYVSR